MPSRALPRRPLMPGFWTDQRVVVTGGAGFLGSLVVEARRERGTEVVVPSGSWPRRPS
jgi:nucleoside-diphosphate-sugar epimerase